MNESQHILAALRHIDSLGCQGMKFGLSRMQAVMSMLNHPQNRYPVIHIAGTNGKGSVAAMTASILRAAGYKVGLYTSPHLESINERFQINNRPIKSPELAGLTFELQALLKRRDCPVLRLTQFEFLTAIAYWWFARQSIDIGVIETGLGGRLDATNVAERVAVSIITNIDFDHMEYLGKTKESIAREKAGIIKSRVPVVTGATGTALAVIKNVARTRQAPLTRISPSGLLSRRYFPGRLPLKGQHQRHNAMLAVSGIRQLSQSFAVKPRHIKRGLANTLWPGRFETLHWGTSGRHRKVILDGAHNPAGVAALKNTLLENGISKVNLLFSVLRDKNARGMIKILEPVTERAIVVPVKSDRSCDPRLMAGSSLWKGKSSWEKTAAQGLKIAVRQPNTAPVIVTGSLYLVGEIRKLIKGKHRK